MRKKSFQKGKELQVIFVAAAAFFGVFLLLPLVLLLAQSFAGTSGVTAEHYRTVFAGGDFAVSLENSFCVSAAAAALAVLLAFLLAYTVNCTNVPVPVKKAITLLTQLPMLLPTITYGFAIIYSFGRQGLLTHIFGRQLFDIYGFQGLLLGYVIYTLPTAFLLIHNAFQFIDQKYCVVSRVMGDSPARTFVCTILRPLAGTIGVAFIQSFFLSFTDYGIPTSVGGKYHVIAMTLYEEMLGAVPNFCEGAVVAVVMLLPSVASVLLLKLLERYNICYTKISKIELAKGRVRDWLCALASGAVLTGILSLFAVVFVVPFVQMWPFRLQLTGEHFYRVFSSDEMQSVVGNSLLVAMLTAAVGAAVAYAAALVTTRSSLPAAVRRGLDAVSSVVNTLPGMVLGIAYLLAFSGTALQSTFAILVLCNVVHYFAAPYQMMKDSLSKMNASWEQVGSLMGDNWFQTILRVVTPNAAPAILQVFSYYFVNAMVTISAVVFLTGAHTMVLTTQISALQHLAKFDEIFVLSLFIFAINLAVKGAAAFVARCRFAKKNQTNETKKKETYPYAA